MSLNGWTTVSHLSVHVCGERRGSADQQIEPDSAQQYDQRQDPHTVETGRHIEGRRAVICQSHEELSDSSWHLRGGSRIFPREGRLVQRGGFF